MDAQIRGEANDIQAEGGCLALYRWFWSDRFILEQCIAISGMRLDTLVVQTHKHQYYRKPHRNLHCI